MNNDLKPRIQSATEAIRVELPDGWSPDVAVILGSGLGALADEVDAVAFIPYSTIPGFATSSVVGHAGRLVLGTLEGTRVVMMQGRFHYYEGYTMQQVTFPVRVMKALGAHTLVVTNAAGGLNPDFQAGDFMLITDHINMLGWGGPNPLVGPNDPDLGPRFPAMNPAYDPELLQIAVKASQSCNVPVRQGVYIVLAGPNYETRAELRLLAPVGRGRCRDVHGAGGAGGATRGHASAGYFSDHQHGPRRRRARQPRRSAGRSRRGSPTLHEADESSHR